MLGKLFKYENRALKKILLPVCFGVILLSILGTAMLKLNMYFDSNFSDNSIINNILSSSTGLILIFSILAIISSCFISVFLILQRYYKNLFTDEGYLTFTLPVKTSQIILSKLLTAIIWTIIVVISTVIGIFIFVIFGTSSEFINYEVIDAIVKFFHYVTNLEFISNFDLILIGLEYLIYLFISLVTSILLMYLAITLGAITAKKHKILASVGFYFIISTIVSIIETIAEFITISFIDKNLFSLSGNIDFNFNYFYLIVLPGLILCCILSVVYFTVNKFILDKKLNIE